MATSTVCSSTSTKYYIYDDTSELISVAVTMDDVVLTVMVMTVVRVIRGSATESRFLPYTVTMVPPLYVLHT